MNFLRSALLLIGRIESGDALAKMMSPRSGACPGRQRTPACTAFCQAGSGGQEPSLVSPPCCHYVPAMDRAMNTPLALDRRDAAAQPEAVTPKAVDAARVGR